MKKVLILLGLLGFCFNVLAADVAITITVGSDDVPRFVAAVSEKDPKPSEYTWKEWGEKLTRDYWKDYVKSYEQRTTWQEYQEDVDDAKEAQNQALEGITEIEVTGIDGGTEVVTPYGD